MVLGTMSTNSWCSTVWTTSRRMPRPCESSRTPQCGMWLASERQDRTPYSQILSSETLSSLRSNITARRGTGSQRSVQMEMWMPISLILVCPPIKCITQSLRAITTHRPSITRRCTPWGLASETVALVEHLTSTKWSLSKNSSTTTRSKATTGNDIVSKILDIRTKNLHNCQKQRKIGSDKANSLMHRTCLLTKNNNSKRTIWIWGQWLLKQITMTWL